MKMLLLNALKALFDKKIQIIAVILLISIAIMVYVAANVAIGRVEDGYYDYLESQKVEHFSFVPSLENLQKEDLILFDDILITEEEQATIATAELCLPDECSSQTMLFLESIFTKYNLQIYLNKDEIKKIANEFDFEYELTKSKLRFDGEKYYKAIPFNEDKQFNLPYLVAGEFPTNDDEITILPNYARVNDLEIGDQYKINDQVYNIVGTAFLPDYIYPLLSFSVPLFDEENNNIMLMNQTTYENFMGIEEKVYSARLNQEYNFKGRDYQEGIIFGEDGILDNEAIELKMSNFLRLLRSDTLQIDIEPEKIFTNAFVNVLLGISAFIILIVVKKRIESEKNQIGILKAIGYNAGVISGSYLVYPIIGALLGSILGYVIGLFLAQPLTDVFISYYNVPLPDHQITLEYITRIFVLPLVLLSIVSFITAYVMVKKPPLFLLREGSHLKINFFARKTNQLLSKKSFKTRFKYSLAFRSLGKLFIVTLVSLASGMLITLTMIGNGLFSDLLDQTFGNMKFDYVVSYNTFMTGESEKDDLFLSIDNDIIQVLDKNNNEKEIEEDISISLTGIEELKYLEIEDENENSLIELLTENKVLISLRIAELNELAIDDQLIMEINDQEKTFIIVGIYEDYFSSSVFIDRLYLSELYGFENPVYNQKYSTDIKYSDTEKIEKEELQAITGIFSIKDLEENIMDEIAVFDYVIYFIISFAALMAFIIMLVIANIIVEENRKNISLMKVLGYRNKEISAIVLNIYTPFIVIAYVLSVPLMVYLVKRLLDMLADDIDFVITVTISFPQAIIGLAAILGAYYLGVSFSRRVLNRISLSEALKRE